MTRWAVPLSHSQMTGSLEAVAAVGMTKKTQTKVEDLTSCLFNIQNVINIDGKFGHHPFDVFEFES